MSSTLWLLLALCGAGAVGLLVIVPLAARCVGAFQWQRVVRTYATAWEAALDPRSPHAAVHVARRRAWLAQVAVGLSALAAHARTCCEVHRLVAAHHGTLALADVASVPVCMERRASMDALVTALRRRFARAELAVDPACAHNQAVLDVVRGTCGARCHFIVGDVEFGPPVCTPAWLSRAHLPVDQRAEMEAQMAAHEARMGGPAFAS